MPAKKVVERGMWSEEEHDKFLEALKVHPRGPWKIIAIQVGTRSARQVQTHAQKYYEKVARRMRGLHKERKKVVRPEHRLDDDMMKLCRVTESTTLFAPDATPPRSGISRVSAATASPLSVDAVSKPDSERSLVAGNHTIASSNAAQTGTSFLSLLLNKRSEPHGLEDCDVSDLDDVDSLADVDEYYLDFLIAALSRRDDCISSDGSISE